MASSTDGGNKLSLADAAAADNAAMASYNPLKNPLLGAPIGGGLALGTLGGAAYGALSSQKGRRLRGMARGAAGGALVGGGIGLGAGLGLRAARPELKEPGLLEMLSWLSKSPRGADGKMGPEEPVQRPTNTWAGALGLGPKYKTVMEPTPARDSPLTDAMSRSYLGATERDLNDRLGWGTGLGAVAGLGAGGVAASHLVGADKEKEKEKHAAFNFGRALAAQLNQSDFG
jgi:hypothetical protein